MRDERHKSAAARGDAVLVCLLAAFVLAAVWGGAPHLIDYDSAQFALAIGQHDLRLHQPQPPGAYFFVILARAAVFLAGNGYAALRGVAVGLLVAGALVLYALGRRTDDRATARLAVLFFVSSPVVLFHAMTTAVYPADALAAALAALACWSARDGGRRRLVAAAFCVGTAGGLRPTAIVFALPLLLHTAAHVRPGWRTLGLAASGLVAGVLVWFVPQLAVAGGASAYWEGNRALQAHILAKSPLHAGWAPLVTHTHRALSVLVFGLGAARLAVLLFAARRGPGGAGSTFLAAWILPWLAFVLAYHFPKSGYALAVWPALALVLARRARRLASLAGRRLLALALAADVGVFFLVPTMQVCCRQDWEIEESAAFDNATLVHWPWVPSAWMRPTQWPPAARRVAQGILGKVDFFFDRTRDFDFGGVLAALDRQGLVRADMLWIGDHATRAACFALPEPLLVHVDANRIAPFVLYSDRRGTPLGEIYDLPAEVRGLLLERQSGTLRFAGTAPPRIELPPPLQKRFAYWQIGTSAVECEFVPRQVAAADSVRLGLRRRD